MIESKFTLLFIITGFLFLNSLSSFGQVEFSQPLKVKEIRSGFELSWTLSDPGDCTNFIIERSLDGQKFEKIDNISVNQYNNKPTKYKYEDRVLGEESVSYRIIELYQDKGKSISSAPVKKTRRSVNNFYIAHTQISKTAYEFLIESVKNENLIYSLRTQQGQVVTQEEFKIQKGFNSWNIDLKNEAAGRYLAFFKMGEKIQVIPINKKSDAALENNTVRINKKN